MTSGFASAYFEWILKAAGGSTATSRSENSVWVRNFQLASFALLAAAMSIAGKDWVLVLNNGFFQGFSPLVWCVVALEATGGITVALVIKHADNLLKNFAIACGIILTTICSYYLFATPITNNFVMGASLVMVSVFLYNSPATIWRCQASNPAAPKAVVPI